MKVVHVCEGVGSIDHGTRCRACTLPLANHPIHFMRPVEYPCLSCRLQGECLGRIKGCVNYTGIHGTVG